MWSPLGFHTATYLLKLFLEQTISTKCCDLLHMFCWFVCTKTKVTTITSEWQSSYNQNNFILMKFNRNNVGIEDNFQVSSFTTFRLNNRMSTNMCDTTVKKSIYLSVSSSWNNQGWSFIQLVWNLIVLLLIPPHWHHTFLLSISLASAAFYLGGHLRYIL